MVRPGRDEQKFEIRKYSSNDGRLDIDRGELNAPAYVYQAPPTSAVNVGGKFRDFREEFVYQFDWNPTVIDLDFDDDQEAKTFLERFGRQPFVVTLSTLTEVDEGDDYRGSDWVGAFFDVQCMIIVGEPPHFRTLSVNGNSVELCEEYLESGVGALRWQDRNERLYEKFKSFREDDFEFDRSIFDFRVKRWLD